jgi:hypothetical protein
VTLSPLSPSPGRGRGRNRKRGFAPLRHPDLGFGIYKGGFKGGAASLPYPSPSPLKERGIKGVR